MIIFPVSPVPTELSRTFDWGENTVKFDSGLIQTMTPRSRPLYQYQMPFQNINIVKQSLLTVFVNSVKGRVFPWLFKDPYDNAVNSVMAVRSGYASGSPGLSLYDTMSFFLRADTTTIGSLFSSLSGYVRLGVEYNYDQDTGSFSINTKAVTDVWGVRSMQYFRKCRFTAPYADTSPVWQQFNTTVKFEEVP
jgi:hypothetical protein